MNETLNKRPDKLIIIGPRLYLRRLTVADATDEYVRWINDPETNRYLESGHTPETIESLREYIRLREANPKALFLAIVLKDGDRHIGNIKLEPIEWHHRRAVLGIMIGDARDRGKGYGTEATQILLRYAFDELRLHRVELGVTADNVPAIRCYQNVGFVEEGRAREAVWRGDRFADTLWMGILDSEFRSRNGEFING